MKIIVATDSFKGCLSAETASKTIADAIAEQLPKAQILTKPLADGGEGTANAMIAACNGRWIPRKVMGPLPNMEVDAGFAWFEKTRTVLVEMACASGITLLSKDQLNPLKTTTYGTGQLIAAALEKLPYEILLAIGGSATVDMGVGAAMALDWQFLDSEGKSVGLGGECLERIEKIIPPPKLPDCRVKVLSDVTNSLYGQNGAAEVFGPQKGANPQTVKRLDAAIKRLSGLIRDKLNIDVSDISGGGAAGGLGAGAAAFMNADIVSGIETIISVINLKKDLADVDWIITGEGRFDNQSLGGKVISGIVRLARQTNTKVAVIAGDVQVSKSEYKKFGVIDAIGLKKNNMTTDYAMQNCVKLLMDAGREFVKIIKNEAD
ncbi:MAG: glycerate kinase [Sedimentisphaerales bacterium]